MKKAISILVMMALVFSFATSTVYAADESVTDSDALLVDNGFSDENVDALPETVKDKLAQELAENPDAVCITTTVLEIDNLAEVESFLSYTNAELIAMGANPDAVVVTRKDLEEESHKTAAQIAKEKNISLTEAKYFKKAIDKGHSNYLTKNHKSKESNNPVTASGSISSSKLVFTQSVSNQSTSTQPQYTVVLSYTWQSVYLMDLFTDEIVVGWGGYLNTKEISSLARYYLNDVWGWYDFSLSKSMSTVETPNAGIEFKFKQRVPTGRQNEYAKTKSGYAIFKLYQTQKQGYDTKVVSHYCHRTINIYSASIAIKSDGIIPTVTIGPAWDKTAQNASTIGF